MSLNELWFGESLQELEVNNDVDDDDDDDQKVYKWITNHWHISIGITIVLAQW